MRARPGCSEPPPAPPWRLQATRQADGLLWHPAPHLEVRTAAGWVELAWHPEPGRSLQLRRAYSEFGQLRPVEACAP